MNRGSPPAPKHTSRTAILGAGALCVGRERELDLLGSYYEEAQAEGERLVLIQGPSGVGKSQLLQELRTRLRLQGAVVLEGRCEPGRAFGPFATIVDRALRFLADMGMTPTGSLADLSCLSGCHRFWHQHADHLEHTSVASQEAREGRLRFFDAIRSLLRDVSRVRAPLVLLHDLERADEGTLQLLAHLFEGAGPWANDVNRQRSLRALFVASAQDDADGFGRLDALRSQEVTQQLHLGPLNADGIKAYFQHDAVVARILDRTGGNPEALELLLEASPLAPEELLRRHLQALPDTVRALLEALAVLQHPADLDELAEVAGVKTDPGSRQAFATSTFLHHSLLDGRVLYSFARQRHRALAYDGLSSERRRELHRRCALRYAAKPGHERAAFHALAAEDLELAVPLALSDAHNLASRHAHGEGAALLERLLKLADGRPVPCDVLQTLADLYRVVGEYRKAIAHAETAVDLDPNNVDITIDLGHLLTLAGEFDRAARTLERAHDLSDTAATTAHVETLLAELNYQRASYDEAERWAHDALAASRDHEGNAANWTSLAIHARNTLGKIALARKNAAAASELFDANRQRAVENSKEHAQALTNLGVSILQQQLLDDAEHYLTAAVNAARTAGDSRELAIATENVAVLAHLRRDYALALERYHEALPLLRRFGHRAMFVRLGINLGELYLSLGASKRARSLSDFARHMGGADLPTSFDAECLVLQGRIDTAEGNIEHARAAQEAALDAYRSLKSRRAADPLLELARLALHDGNVEAAEGYLAQVPEQDSPKRKAKIALIKADYARAVGGRVLVAAETAFARCEETQDPELLLESYMGLAQAQWDAGHRHDAFQSLAEAEGIDRDLGQRVPEETKDAWNTRPAKRRLEALQGRLSRRRASTPPIGLRRSEALDAQFPDIVGTAPTTLQLLQVLEKVAPSDATVLIRGESGTGKELVADALHRNSKRSGRPFVKVNCAALVETLLMSELFGHERGAFTGASSRKKGRFELADGGTLFLDEIGDISPQTQVALLRVLQERQFERVGGTQSIKVDVRIIAATHRDLEAMVREGTFREDLYYRLRGLAVEVPSLRSRLSDLPALSTRILSEIAKEREEPAKVVSDEALEMLRRHQWPGNVRELENMLRSASLFSEGTELLESDFSVFSDVFADAPMPQDVITSAALPVEEAIYERIREGDTSLFDMKKVIERECIVRALGETDGNITRAASLLGMKRPRLSQLVKQYGLEAHKGSPKRARA